MACPSSGGPATRHGCSSSCITMMKRPEKDETYPRQALSNMYLWYSRGSGACWTRNNSDPWCSWRAAEEQISAMKCIRFSNNLVVWSQSVPGESFALPSFHPSSQEWGRKELPLLQPQDFWATLRNKNVTECSLLLLLTVWVIQYFFYLFYCELLVPTCS